MTETMPTETPKQIATRIVERMFTNGGKEKANRLILVKEPFSGAANVTSAVNLGGWCRQALVDFIEDEIRAERLRSGDEP